MWGELRFDRVSDFSKSIFLGCLLLSLASGISAQDEQDILFEEELESLTDDENTFEKIDQWKGDEIPSTLDDVPEPKEEITYSEGTSGRAIENKAEDIRVTLSVSISMNSVSSEADKYAPRSSESVLGYQLTEARLNEIRSQFMYWYFDKGGDNNEGDYQRRIQSSTPQIQKDLNFQLPFFGFRFNYTRVSVNGYLEFSDPPEYYTYPLIFPVRDWPKKNDPSFIGIFFSKCRIGNLRRDDIDQRLPGVYFRLENDLQTRKDQFGVELRERLKWDIRDEMIGSKSFEPKHAIIVTWKNISFAGGIDKSLYNTNTFQMVLATDEEATYAIFNYLNIQWTSHTEAGGDIVSGEGGVPAFVGFNAGNGTRSYEYRPFSQRAAIHGLTGTGWVNGFPGRHMFKIDGKFIF